MSEKIDLKVTDGSSMRAYIARPKDTAVAGIMVLQEAFGVDGHIRDVADRLAKEGYLAIAPELFHRSVPPGFEAAHDAFDKVMPIIQAMTVPTMKDDMKTCFDWLKQNGAKNVASIGFCLGGRASFVANSFLPLKAAISFYGGRIVPDLLPLAKTQSGPLLFFWGGLDKHIGTEQPRAIADALLKESKPFTDVFISNVDHGFFNTEKKVFDAHAALDAWVLIKQFLKTQFS